MMFKIVFTLDDQGWVDDSDFNFCVILQLCIPAHYLHFSQMSVERIPLQLLLLHIPLLKPKTCTNYLGLS